MSTAMDNQEKLFFCLLCSHTSKSQLSMRNHVMETHVPEESFYRRNNTCADKQINISRTQLRCQTCLRFFRKKCHLKNHMRSHTPRMKQGKCHGSSSTKSFLYSGNLQPVRRSRRTARRQLQHDGRDTAVREYLQKTVLQSPKSHHSSSFSSVNWLPKVVLSSQLNLLLSRTSGMHSRV